MARKLPTTECCWRDACEHVGQVQGHVGVYRALALDKDDDFAADLEGNVVHPVHVKHVIQGVDCFGVSSGRLTPSRAQ